MSFSLIPQVYAACTAIGDAGINLGDCLTLKDGSKVSDVYSQSTDIVNLVVRNVFILAGIIIFILLILAGYKYISDTSKGKDEAKTMIETALIGFILMFSAFWIVQIVKISTGIDYLGF